MALKGFVAGSIAHLGLLPIVETEKSKKPCTPQRMILWPRSPFSDMYDEAVISDLALSQNIIHLYAQLH